MECPSTRFALPRVSIVPISLARKDDRVLPLITEVSKNYKIRYHRSHDAHWGCEVVGKTAHISYQKTKNPGGALAHELLHVITQHNGYRRPKVWFSTIDQTWRFDRLMGCLDNELQHHKMYARFAQAGFTPTEFYADDDSETPDRLEEVLARSSAELIDVLPDYFTLIAPGGCLPPEQRERLEVQFMQLRGGQFSTQFTSIKSTVEQWALSGTYDARPTFRAIFLILQDPCYTWLGFTEHERPPEGFFVDQIFEIEEAIA